MSRKTLPVIFAATAATVMISHSAFAESTFPSEKGELTIIEMDLDKNEMVETIVNSTPTSSEASFVKNIVSVRFTEPGACTNLFVITTEKNRKYKVCDTGVSDKM